jgi:hypothetical protein
VGSLGRIVRRKTTDEVQAYHQSEDGEADRADFPPTVLARANMVIQAISEKQAAMPELN